ncbi:hypothetical protein Glove_292g103 [Diversispora epigaea]|uniref:Uncharacterized protein n=1 Tax=Diversispora epigaea TaxID=1348612 RepID=A0A397I079_9GLOM|nr:hypothetical protein Glove_292g103 [Diversispora epigaea]
MSHFITSPFSNRISNFSTLTNSQIIFALPLTPIDFTSNSPLSKKSRTIENNNNNITSFKKNNDKKFEEDCYPKINVIRYQGKHTYYYQYNILDLGNYPTNARYTQRSRHRIPNGYRIQVLIYEREIICQTNYEFNRKVIYKVTWEEKDGKKCCVNSLRSASDAAKQFVQKITNAKGSTLSGVILFDLDLEYLFDSHRFSNINLDSLKLNIQGQFIRIKFSNSNNKLESQIQLDSIIHVCDNNLISREKYRQLSAVQPSLEREWHLAVRKKKINLIMENKIPIKNFNINPINKFSIIQENNENNSTIYLNENIEKIIINKDQMGNGLIRSLIGLLITLIPDLTEGNNPVLYNNNIIKIKLGGDGRQVGRYNYHVMLTACILNEKDKVLSPKYQYCICLYPETEKYESLTIAHNQIIEELTTLYNNSFTDENNNHWKIEFWFTGD